MANTEDVTTMKSTHTWQKITDVIRRRKISFYGHMAQTSLARFANRIFTNHLENKTKRDWFSEVEERGSQETWLTRDDIRKLDPLKINLNADRNLFPRNA